MCSNFLGRKIFVSIELSICIYYASSRRKKKPTSLVQVNGHRNGNGSSKELLRSMVCRHHEDAIHIPTLPNKPSVSE